MSRFKLESKFWHFVKFKTGFHMQVFQKKTFQIVQSHVVKLVERWVQHYCYLECPGSIPPGVTWYFLLSKIKTVHRAIAILTRVKVLKFCKIKKIGFERKAHGLASISKESLPNCKKPFGQVGRVLGTTLLWSWVPRFDPTSGDIKFSLIENDDWPMTIGWVTF